MAQADTEPSKTGQTELSGEELCSVVGGSTGLTTAGRSAISPQAAVGDEVLIAFEQGDIHHPY